jgi:hypothetical protein
VDKYRQLSVDEIAKQIKGLRPIEQAEIISLTLSFLNVEKESIIDDENEEHELCDTFYDSIKDSFRFVTKER